MSVRLGLLAILDQGPCYGYQLRGELDRRTGGVGPINVGQIYNTLDRLERDQLVRKAGTDAEQSNYYEITDAGRAAVRDWFAGASAWSDLAAKLALATTLPGVDAAAVIRVQRAATEAVLATGADPDPSDPTRKIIAAAARAAAETELRFLDQVERMIAAGVAPIPLSTEIPRRGRPAKTHPVPTG